MQRLKGLFIFHSLFSLASILYFLVTLLCRHNLHPKINQIILTLMYSNWITWVILCWMAHSAFGEYLDIHIQWTLEWYPSPVLNESYLRWPYWAVHLYWNNTLFLFWLSCRSCHEPVIKSSFTNAPSSQPIKKPESVSKGVPGSDWGNKYVWIFRWSSVEWRNIINKVWMINVLCRRIFILLESRSAFQVNKNIFIIYF